MELTVSRLMLIFFIMFLIISLWKIWAFLPNKQLADDDKTQEAEEELQRLMLKVIKENRGDLDEKKLFLKISTNENFNSKLFWRFNLNRLKQLLNSYYLHNPEVVTIRDIYEEIKD